jgi:SulP family sulfate permease
VIGRTGAPAALRRLLPRSSDYAGLRQSWRGDVLAGVTVGVVALPLALAFGITSGMGAAAGMVCAIVAGLVAAVFGGSNLQVSGPTGAMTVVLVPIVQQHGARAVLVVGLMAGVLMVAAAVAQLGRALAYVPWPVIEGFTVGIAAVILLQQVPAAVGVRSSGGDRTAVAAARAVQEALAAHSTELLTALLLVALVAAIMVVTPRVLRSIPASLLAVAVATALAWAAHLPVDRIGRLPSGLPLPGLPSVSIGELGDLAPAALAVALLAAMESLLSAKVADGLADAPRHDPDRELFGQGLANIAASAFGSMPATGAIARTAVNARSGARTRVAAGAHALVLAAVVYAGGGLVAQIPLAALAGVLLVTAVRMVEIHNVRAVLRSTRSDALVLALTALATVVFDLIVAVEIGLAVAAVLMLRKVALSASAVSERVPPEVGGPAEDESAEDGSAEGVSAEAEHQLMAQHIVTYRLDGVLFFGAAQRFLTELTAVTDVRVLILRLPDLQVLDATGAQALGEIVAELEGRGVTVLIKGARPAHLRTLRAVGAIDRLAHERHVFDDLDVAIAHARSHVRAQARSPARQPVAVEAGPGSDHAHG